jgi:dihydroorotase
MIREFTRKRGFHGSIALALATVISVFAQPAAPAYDLLLRGGHVLDDKNHIDSVMDVAIKDGKIARVASMSPA